MVQPHRDLTKDEMVEMDGSQQRQDYKHGFFSDGAHSLEKELFTNYKLFPDLRC